MGAVTVEDLGTRGGMVLEMTGGIERCIAEMKTGAGTTAIGRMMEDLGVAVVSMGEEVMTEASRGELRLMKGIGTKRKI